MLKYGYKYNKEQHSCKFDVQFQISRPYNENGKTYATLTVMRKSGEVIAKIKVLTLKDGKSTEMRQ